MLRRYLESGVETLGEISGSFGVAWWDKQRPADKLCLPTTTPQESHSWAENQPAQTDSVVGQVARLAIIREREPNQDGNPTTHALWASVRRYLPPTPLNF